MRKQLWLVDIILLRDDSDFHCNVSTCDIIDMDTSVQQAKVCPATCSLYPVAWDLNSTKNTLLDRIVQVDSKSSNEIGTSRPCTPSFTSTNEVTLTQSRCDCNFLHVSGTHAGSLDYLALHFQFWQLQNNAYLHFQSDLIVLFSSKSSHALW